MLGVFCLAEGLALWVWRSGFFDSAIRGTKFFFELTFRNSPERREELARGESENAREGRNADCRNMLFLAALALCVSLALAFWQKSKNL